MYVLLLIGVYDLLDVGVVLYDVVFGFGDDEYDGTFGFDEYDFGVYDREEEGYRYEEDLLYDIGDKEVVNPYVIGDMSE